MRLGPPRPLMFPSVSLFPSPLPKSRNRQGRARGSILHAPRIVKGLSFSPDGITHLTYELGYIP